MLKVTNFGAACCVIESMGVRILTDPWLSGDIYLGAWERSDYLPDPLTTIGPVDYVWISHIHEDHLHAPSLRSYIKAYPGARVWIGEHCKYLERMTAEFSPLKAFVIGKGTLTAHSIANHGNLLDSDNVDSALVVRDHDSAVVNMNDCPFDQGQVDRINQLTAGKHVTALIPYSGAGPWPQCYKMSPLACIHAARMKEAKYLALFDKYRSALNADVAVPFSAGYQLRGPLAELNPYRGIPRQQDVPFATVLPVCGAAPRAWYAWENHAHPTNARIEELLRLAGERSPKLDGDPLTIDINWTTGAAYVDATHAPAKTAHETIMLDSRLLEGLLTREYHWNTAEISSVLKITRHGDAYDPRVFGFLCRFHI